MAEKAYHPPQKILENYAKVLIRFGLNNGKGIKKGEVAQLGVPECAKPLLIELHKEVLKAGGHPIIRMYPDNTPDANLSKDFYKLANDKQLSFYPEKSVNGLLDTIDHRVGIIAESMKGDLEGVDAKKIMKRQLAWKPFMDRWFKLEGTGKKSRTLALYGTPAMAKEVGLSQKVYWNQIIKACFLDEKDPVKKNKEVYAEIEKYRNKLNKLEVEKFHIVGEDVDLWIKLSPKSKWLSGRGVNMPSFEIFTSPDWRGTEGWIRFNQPLYRYGVRIEGIELWFKEGKVIKSKATKNYKVLKEMIAVENADKVGEFSMTDARFSRITKFMGETLYDENVGGKYGNTHIALGMAYKDCYKGDPARVSKKQWDKLGYNESAIHTDIISTTDRTVTAYLKGGKEKMVYEKGQFTI